MHHHPYIHAIYWQDAGRYAPLLLGVLWYTEAPDGVSGSDLVPAAACLCVCLPSFLPSQIGYFKNTVQLLQCICKTCSRVLLPEEERRKWLK